MLFEVYDFEYCMSEIATDWRDDSHAIQVWYIYLYIYHSLP